MKYTFFFCLSALLTFKTFVFSESEENASIKKYFVEKFTLSDTEKNSVNLLIDDILTWQAPTIPISKIKTIVTYAFGNRILLNGNRIPGPTNEQLADLVVEVHKHSNAHVYAQWEVAEAIGNRIPKKLLTAINPKLDNNGNVLYLSTKGVAEEVMMLANKNTKALGSVAIIGFNDHIRRCIEISRDIGIDAYVPEGYNMPAHYDELSGQPWTRNRFCYLEHEFRKRFN